MTNSDRPGKGRKPFSDKRGAVSGNRKAGGGMKPARPRPSGEDEAGRSERIARRLARAGIASRREAETMIAAGRVSVNGKVLTSPAVNVSRADAVAVDGKPLPAIERTRLWLYHKPAGLVTTNRDPEGRPTVFESLPQGMPRVLTIGRLDINTEGLLLLTNDGGLARILELPSTGWLRRYRVRAHGEVTQEQLDRLREGVAVDGVFYGAVEAQLERVQGSNVWIEIGLREGKNREVKNVLGSLGLAVNRLIRISFGPFQLGDLDSGAVREIRGRTLREQLGERLIEEAGCDFDAPVLNPFSNAEVRAEPASGEGGKREARPERRREREWISSSPARPQKPRRSPDEKRDEALSRLSTKPDRDDRPARRDDRPAKGGDGPGERKQGGPMRKSRTANVWMAPGARPTRNAARSGETGGEEKRARRSDASDKPFRDKPKRQGAGPSRSGAGKPDAEGRADRPKQRSGPQRPGKPGGGRSGSSGDRKPSDRGGGPRRPKGKGDADRRR